ncbi:MAG: stage II sporulation protein M [Pseudomonadota bacterium]
MKQEQFEALHRKEWDDFEDWLRTLSGSRRSVRREATERGSYPALYRRICHHLALARARRYSTGLQQKLNHLALEGHQYLYRQQDRVLLGMARFLAYDFPRAVRDHGRYLFVSCLLFFATGIVTGLALIWYPDLIFSIMSPGQVQEMEQMYDPANDTIGRDRDSGSDMVMFGYYIYNNISIGFRTFAGGLLFGLGTVFFLVFNGLVIGSVASHLTLAGYVETFWGFVSGHSSFELIAIVLFGAVGLALGSRLIAPGRKARWLAVRDQARESLPVIYGATLMLLIAAFVEAFWSATTWPPVELKYAVGLSLWALHIVYFTVFGRNESRKRHG